MARSKSTHTSFVGILTFTIHPYACFSRLSCAYWCWLVHAILQWVFSTCMQEKHPILWLRIVGFDSVALLLHPMHIDTQKASVGMYSECDYPYKSCSCTFWPSHPSFVLQFCSIIFIFVSLLSVSFMNAILHGLLIQLSMVHHWPSIEDEVCTCVRNS